MKVAKSKKVIFSVAVAFISVFFFAYAIQAVYPGPERSDYCDDKEYYSYLEPNKATNYDNNLYEAECGECGEEAKWNQTAGAESGGCYNPDDCNMVDDKDWVEEDLPAALCHDPDNCNETLYNDIADPESDPEVDWRLNPSYENCWDAYEAARAPYERNVFFANLIVGLIVLIVAFFLAIEAVSSGLMGGAVMLIVYGSMRYWGHLSDVWRTLMLGVALVVLIWFGYKKLAD